MARNLNFKVGTCYVVRFLDHTAGSEDIVEVEIVGWCIGIKDRHVTFSAWRLDTDDSDMVSNNHEPFSIIKTTILKKRAITIPTLTRTKR